jgi:hypothetical protein
MLKNAAVWYAATPLYAVIDATAVRRGGDQPARSEVDRLTEGQLVMLHQLRRCGGFD